MLLPVIKERGVDYPETFNKEQVYVIAATANSGLSAL
jgi:hypothetical protein